MKRIMILAAVLAACFAVRAQTPEFMKLYGEAIRSLAVRSEDGGCPAPDIETSEFSGRMLRDIMPAKSRDRNHLVNRIDMIRQIKFLPSDGSDLFDRIRAVAGRKPYERLLNLVVDGQSVCICSAPCKTGREEFLIFIVKDDKRLVCDIVGDVTLKDVLDLICKSV